MADVQRSLVTYKMLKAGSDTLWALSETKEGERLIIPSIGLIDGVPALYRAMRAAHPSATSENVRAALRRRRHRERLAAAKSGKPVEAEPVDELEALRRDAERYRYLRNRPDDTIGRGGIFAGKTPPTGKGGFILTEEDLDKAVDAAMAAAEGTAS